MKKKRLSFEQFWMKKNNVKHEGAPSWITTGHNTSDAEFLSGNKEALQKLQQNIG